MDPIENSNEIVIAFIENSNDVQIFLKYVWEEVFAYQLLTWLVMKYHLKDGATLAFL